jgi:hypothetical protein
MRKTVKLQPGEHLVGEGKWRKMKENEGKGQKGLEEENFGDRYQFQRFSKCFRISNDGTPDTIQ